MQLKSKPELHAFLSTYFPDVDPDTDDEVTRSFASKTPADRQRKIAEQAEQVLSLGDFPLDELGTEANRWFGDAEEGRAWLRRVVGLLQGSHTEASVVVKDSNGTPLAEGDSVQVIKDLKVKGGSSDLKRGTLIKKIHLVDDPEVIECRVDGSTLVLKTCFLKKS